jgi:hypothetical protein
MTATNKSQKRVSITLHDAASTEQPVNPSESDQVATRLYPDLDADGDYVHFEMTPMQGDSLLWLTLRRGITPQRAALSLRKIADLIDREGLGLLEVLEGRDEPVRLSYNEAGDIIIEEQK